MRYSSIFVLSPINVYVLIKTPFSSATHRFSLNPTEKFQALNTFYHVPWITMTWMTEDLHRHLKVAFSRHITRDRTKFMLKTLTATWILQNFLCEGCCLGTAFIKDIKNEKTKVKHVVHPRRGERERGLMEASNSSEHTCRLNGNISLLLLAHLIVPAQTKTPAVRSKLREEGSWRYQKKK